MAKKGGSPENLNPIRTKDEARKRGRNGGIKSGESRRNKRDARNAVNLLLNMAAKGELKTSLDRLGVKECDCTNMLALQAKLFEMAVQGNLEAYDRIMLMSGNDPREKRRDRETEAKISAVAASTAAAEESGSGDNSDDVIIMMPYDGRQGTKISENTAPDFDAENENS